MQVTRGASQRRALLRVCRQGARDVGTLAGAAPSTPEGGSASTADIAKLCDSYLKDYGIIPEDSWGTAPEKIQYSWKKLKCDRVLAEEGFSMGDAPTGGRKRAVVVVWNKIQGWLEYLRPEFVKAARETCPTECVFTDDKDLIPQSNGVLFHAPTHDKRDFPHTKPKGVSYVFVNLEPTTYKPVQALTKDKKLMSKFDITMTYERSSDVPLGYVGSSPTSRYFDSPKATFEAKDGFGAPDAIAAFVSNCKASGATKRFEYMQQLMKHATVHSYGHCLNNREEPVLVQGGGTTNRQQNKVDVLGHYKFFLAFENNDQLTDYVTEKVYNGLQAGTLPIYWGAKNIDDYVPKGSVVKTSDFSSPEALAKHLKFLSEDRDAYEAYFAWRDDAVEEERFQKVGDRAYALAAQRGKGVSAS
eukprot:jgi/Undpi1/12858/HiC_scaffold_7.g02525.m1